MEQKFSNNSLDLETLREFCRREGEAVIYRRGDQLEREGDPARWLAFVTEGCFKYVTHGLSDDREHITWFLTSSSFTNRGNPLIQNMADDPEHDIFRLAKTITTGFSPSPVGFHRERHFTLLSYPEHEMAVDTETHPRNVGTHISVSCSSISALCVSPQHIYPSCPVLFILMGQWSISLLWRYGNDRGKGQ